MKELNLPQLLNKVKRVVFVYPHPDDEVPFSCGLAQKIISNHKTVETKLVCLCRGEASTLNHVNSKDLAKTRHQELSKSANIVGYQDVEVANFNDGSLTAQSKEIRKYLKKQINTNDLVVTYEPGGISGHPDHQIISSIVTDIANKTLYSTIKANTIDSSDNIYSKNPPKPLQPNLLLNLSESEVEIKIRALKAHASQWGINGQHILGFWNNNSDLTKEYFTLQTKL